MQEQKKLIIIGGGAAGLMAAGILADHYQVTLLEAQNRLGGRIRTETIEGFSGVIEGGPEFIHGELPLTMRLLDEAGVSYVPVEGKMYRKEKGALIKEADMFEGWDMVLQRMEALPTDMTLDAFLQQYYRDEEDSEIRQQVKGYAEGFDVADPALVSVKALYREWSAEEGDNFRIPGGYIQLVDHLTAICTRKGCTIQMGKPAEKVAWQPGAVTVYTPGALFEAEKLLVTLPISLLKQSSIEFNPALPGYIAAAKNIGMGAVVKVVIEFSERLWKADTGFLLSEEEIPTWWTQLPDERYLLTGWAGGPKAAELKNRSDEAIQQIAINSLAGILDLPADVLQKKIVAVAIYNWLPSTYAAGAYTFEMPGSALARKTLSIPVADTIWFAGEALYAGDHPGTVEAALVNGKEVAEKILAG